MERPFLEKAKKPTEQTLQSALGDSYAFYTWAIKLAGAFSQSWTFTKSSGWMLKVHDLKKALFYLIPLHEGLKFSLTMREAEREIFLRDVDLAAMHDSIASARKFHEGFALHFDVASQEDFQAFELFTRKLIAERG